MSEHIASFRIHAAEVDAHAELPTAALLRLLQQAASDASAAVGYDLAWYHRQGAVWLIRRSTVELPGEPLRYPDRLAIRTWVSDIRRVRSQREYEVRRADGSLACRGHSDWVYVDTRRGRPVTPPAELQQALMPHGIVRLERPARAAGAPPQSSHRSQRRVELAHLDSVAHVNNAQYAAFCEQALCDALAAHGGTVAPVPGSPHLRPAAVDMEYFEAALYGDSIDIQTWIDDVRGNGFSAHHVLSIGEKRCVRGTWRWAWTGGALPEDLARAAGRLR